MRLKTRELCEIPISRAQQIAIYSTVGILERGRSQWYCDGVLHRDYGPAVVGAVGVHAGRIVRDDYSSLAIIWSNYHRGAQVSADANTCAGDVERFSPQLLERFSPQLLERCGRHCDCVRIVARYQVIQAIVGSVNQASACVYQTCVGVVIECFRRDDAVVGGYENGHNEFTKYNYFRVVGDIHMDAGDSPICSIAMLN